MSPTEAAYVAGIIDGEGWVEYRYVNRTRNTRPGKPTYRTLIVRMEVPQVDEQGHQTFSQTSSLQRSTSLAPVSSWRLPSAQAGLQAFNCKEGESKTCH